MGDVIALLHSLNLSPINTMLLAIILVVLWRVFDQFSNRIATLEKDADKQGRSIAFIKGRLDLVETEEE